MNITERKFQLIKEYKNEIMINLHSEHAKVLAKKLTREYADIDESVIDQWLMIRNRQMYYMGGL